MTAPGAGIEVAGDLAVGWQLVVPLADGMEDGIAGGTAAPADAGGRGPATAWVASLPGGAALLGRLLSDAVAAATGASIGPVLAPGLPPAALAEPAYDGVARQYSLWRPYPKNTAGAGTVWRQAQLLGLQAAGPDGALAGSRDALGVRDARDGGDGADAAGPACLVVEDTGLGFRSTPGAWPASLRRLGEAGRPKPRHVVLRQVSALGTGPLWEHLLAHAGDRLTVCCNVAGLRAEQAEIGQPLSWERTASEVVRAIDRHPTLRAAGRVVVTLGMCGAVAIERGGARTLIYDPLHQEGDWEAQRPGMPIGNDVAVAVALVMAYAQEGSGAGWLAALARGLTAGRLVHDGGFLAGGVPGLAAESAGALRFPIREAMPLLTGAREATAFERVAIPPEDDWTILAARAAGAPRPSRPGSRRRGWWPPGGASRWSGWGPGRRSTGSRSRACAASATSSRSTSATPGLGPSTWPSSARRDRASPSPSSRWPAPGRRAACPWPCSSSTCPSSPPRPISPLPCSGCATARWRGASRSSSGTSSTPPRTGAPWAGWPPFWPRCRTGRSSRPASCGPSAPPSSSSPGAPTRRWAPSRPAPWSTPRRKPPTSSAGSAATSTPWGRTRQTRTT